MTLYREWLKKILENEHQRTAVEKDGHTVVIAGPGSGKTRVLSIRIAKLLRDEIPQPKGVACLTYTRMMSKELENRLSSFGVLHRPNIFIGTVHSFCLQQILIPFSELFGLAVPQPIKISPTPIWNECLSLAREKVTGEKFDPDLDRNFKTELTKYHLEKIDMPYREWQNQKFAEIIQQLHANLYAQGYIDFDIVIKFTIELLANHDFVRQSLYSKFEWLAVDEYQDLGYPLFKIVDLLLQNTSIKLFAIGDPDQSIFDFAGTDPRYLISLAQMPIVQPVIKLNKNYRSTTEIIQIAKAINQPFCNYDSDKVGGKVRVYESFRYNQGDIAAQLVKKYINLGIKAENIAILHPWRESKDKLEGINVIAKKLTGIKFALDKNPYYDRNMTIIRWLEDLAFWCLNNFSITSDNIDGRSYDELISTWFQISNSQHHTQFDVYERLKLTEFIWAFQGKDMPLWMWLEQVSNKLRFDRSLDSYEKNFPDEVAEYRKLKELTRPGSELAEMTLQNFLDMTRGVQLTTIHSSKGMEFEIVIITGIERVWDTDNGRRLLYVAVTRAEKDACLIYTKVRPEWNPSKPPHILNLENKCSHLPFFQSFPLHNIY